MHTIADWIYIFYNFAFFFHFVLFCFHGVSSSSASLLKAKYFAFIVSSTDNLLYFLTIVGLTHCLVNGSLTVCLFVCLFDSVCLWEKKTIFLSLTLFSHLFLLCCSTLKSSWFHLLSLFFCLLLGNGHLTINSYSILLINHISTWRKPQKSTRFNWQLFEFNEIYKSRYSWNVFFLFALKLMCEK